MISRDVVIWSFPILFMFQDFEEIILVKAWRKRYAKYLEEKRAHHEYEPYKISGGTATMTICVLFEFTVITIVCTYYYSHKI